MELLTILIGGGLFAFIQWAVDKVSSYMGKKDKTAEAIEKLSKQITHLQEQEDEREAMHARTHILRFADELYNGTEHSQEYFSDILDDVTAYEHYCESHPDFPNAKTVLATKRIKETYERLHEEHKFL